MAAAYCWSMTHRTSFKKLEVFLLGRPRGNFRIYPASTLPNAVQRPICSQLCGNATHIRRLNSIHTHHGRQPKCRAEYVAIPIQEHEEHISKATLIWRAIKLPMYSVALIPLTVGSAAAYWQTGYFCAKRYLTLLISSVCVIGWLNLSNDVHDFDKGADSNKKESVVHLVGSRTTALVVACFLLALGLMGLARVSVETESSRSLLLLVCAIFCGYIYQGGIPFGTTIFSSLLVGFTTSLILFCSHFHQVEDDKGAGKLSPLVRLGTEMGTKVVKVAVIALYSSLFILGFGLQVLPFSCVVLGALTLPVGNLLSTFVENNHMDKSKIFMAKYYCVRLHAVFGIALAAGLVAARLLVRKQLPQAIIL